MRDIDLPALIERGFASRLAQFGWFLALALLTRFSTFGDPGYHNDELLYFLIGQRMHDGFLPYVDIWDRKGPGLFLIFYLIAAISRSVVAYQLAATVFAAATAFVANAIAERFAGRIGALLTGSLYLVMLPLFAGGGGQAPVFYNLFVALAAWIVFTRQPNRPVGTIDYFAMTSAGFAMTFKQTAVFEGIFLGAVLLWQLHSSGTPPGQLARTAFGLALAGALPLLIFGGIYAALGHFPELWHALVTSNLLKPSDPAGDAGRRIAALATIASPLLLPALATMFLTTNPTRALLAGWLLVALAGVAAVPNFIDHYMLPLLLPLAVAAAPALAWRRIGPCYALFVLLFALLVGPSFKFAERRASREALQAITAEIRAKDHFSRLFVYQGPTYLYALVGSYAPTPLIFPVHLFHRPERNTSQFDTAGEVRKVIAWRPTTVVRAHDVTMGQLNRETAALVDAYVARCRERVTRTIVDYYGPQKIDIFTRCASTP